GRHHLPRAAAEQQRLGSFHHRPDRRTHRLGIEERYGPSAVLEPAVRVLLAPAGRLHDTVEAHEVTEDDAHLRSLSPSRSSYGRAEPCELIAAVEGLKRRSGLGARRVSAAGRRGPRAPAPP